MRRAQNGDTHHVQSQNQFLTQAVYIYLSIFALTFVRAWPIANRVGGHRWPEVLCGRHESSFQRVCKTTSQVF